MILHTLAALPGSPAFEDCLNVLGAKDAVVLLGDGVYCALPNTDFFGRLRASGASLHVLRDDALAAGLVQKFDRVVAVIGMEDFVTLTETFPRQLGWY